MRTSGKAIVLARGAKISYAVQLPPDGLARFFLIGLLRERVL